MMKKPVLLLDVPCPPGEKRVMGFQPLSLLSLGSYLEDKGESVVIVDGRAEGLTIDGMLRRVRDVDPYMVGIPTFTPFIAYACNVSSAIKKENPDVEIVLGGPHVNGTYPESMHDCRDIDFCIFGEAEESLLELVRVDRTDVAALGRIEGLVYRAGDRVAVNPARKSFIDLRSFPPLNYELIDRMEIRNYDSIFAAGKRAMAMVVSRGCPFKCTFCGAQTTHGHRVRYAPVENVLSEIEDKVSRYGVGYVSMKDSTFTVNRKWVVEFCDKLIRRNIGITWGCNARVDCVDEDLLALMTKSGLVNMGFGIESGTNRILDIMQKGITVDKVEQAIRMARKFDLIIGAGYMLGNYTERLAEIRETVALARRLGLPLTAFSSTVAYPGTPLFEQAKAAGVLKSDRWYIEKDSRGSFVPVGLTAGNLKFDDYDSEAQVRIAYRKFYFTPKYIFIFMKLAWKHPALMKYGVFYMWRLVKLICFKKKSQHI